MNITRIVISTLLLSIMSASVSAGWKFSRIQNAFTDETIEVKAGVTRTLVGIIELQARAGNSSEDNSIYFLASRSYDSFTLHGAPYESTISVRVDKGERIKLPAICTMTETMGACVVSMSDTGNLTTLLRKGSRVIFHIKWFDLVSLSLAGSSKAISQWESATKVLQGSRGMSTTALN